MNSNQYINRGDFIERSLQPIIFQHEKGCTALRNDAYKREILNAFNAGMMSLMERSKAKASAEFAAKADIANKYTPASFIQGETAQALIDYMIDDIKDKITERGGGLKAGATALFQGNVAKLIATAYALGITNGFELASDDDLKKIYLESENAYNI